MNYHLPKYTLYILILLSAAPFLWLLTQPQVLGSYTAAFGNIAGFLGTLLMMWQLLLSNRFLMRKISPDYVGSVNLHMIIGVYSFFFVLIHPIIQILNYGETLAFALVPQLTTDFGQHVSLGIAALYLYLLIWATSALIRNRLPYRLWQYVHYLAYPMLFFVFEHAQEIGSYLATFPLIKGYWFFLNFSYVLFIAVRFFQLMGFGKHLYRVESVEKTSSNITQYSLIPQDSPIQPTVGQFCFLKIGLTSEAHPFTVMRFNEETGQLQFSIKTVGKYTSELAQLKPGKIVQIDGPYGIFTREGQNSAPKVLIAGGIGATPFIELVRRFANKRTYMLHANRKIADAVAREELKQQLGHNYLDIISREEIAERQIVTGRIDADILAAHIPAEIIKTANFFVCGSQGFMDTVAKALKTLNVTPKRIYTEEFSF